MPFTEISMKKTGKYLFFPLALVLLSGCIFSQTQFFDRSIQEKAMAEVVFQVTLPSSPQVQPQYMLEVLDEVTGLSLNPVRYPLNSIDSTHYFGRISFELGAIIKYRYIRMDGIPKVEFNTKNAPVRYRLHQVNGPAILEDTIAGWEDSPYSGLTGNLTGTVTNQDNIPIPNAMIIAGGERVFTNSEGYFTFYGLPVGMQNLAVLSLDGAQTFFEQGARIAENAVTPARIYLEDQGNVNITFEVTPPSDLVSASPLRLIGDLYQLGNTIADLEGGMNTIATRAPLLQFDAARNLYTGILSLPAGASFRYKYSLGDGFWNAETDGNGLFVIRDYSVPNQDSIVRDSLVSFTSPGRAPVEFLVTAPMDTPAGTALSIQFNPFSWMGSIPLIPQGNNLWNFTLSSPLSMIPQAGFRVCRNDQCGETDADMSGLPNIFSPSLTQQSLVVNPATWVWMDDQGVQPIIPSQVPVKGPDYIRAVEIVRDFQPRWQPRFDETYKTIRSINANWVFLTPTWSYIDGVPSSMRIEPGENPFWLDTSHQIQQARSNQLSTAVFPSLIITTPSQNNSDIPLTKAGWEEWFTDYRSFLLFYADLAAVNQADALILGGTGASISLPDRIAIADLNTENSSIFATAQWQALISEIRNHYRGKIFWASRFPNENQTLPSFISEMDGIYLLWDGIPGYDPAATQQTIANQVADQVSFDEIEYLSALGKPVIVGLWIESSAGITQVCPEQNTVCLDELANDTTEQLKQNDLQKQVNIYSEAIDYFSNQSWVTGIVSRGFFPPAELLDPSASIHGKPAGQTLSAWFSGMAGNAPQ
jgi:hypothetical protein